jgi:hypothetical protein
MIKLLKVGKDRYLERFKPKSIDEQGNEVFLVPTDINALKELIKATIDWFTEHKYINRKLAEIKESLDDLSTEKAYLEGIFDANGIDPNAVRKATVQIILGLKTRDEAVKELSIPDELLAYFDRSIEIAKIFDWKERVWRKEAELEAQVDVNETQVETAEELLELYKDIPALCERAYSEIPLEVSGD